MKFRLTNCAKASKVGICGCRSHHVHIRFGSLQELSTGGTLLLKFDVALEKKKQIFADRKKDFKN